MELIPGLTNDLGRECLFRVPFQFFGSLLSVCKAWNQEIRNPDFHRYRKLAGLTRPVFIITQRSKTTSTQWIVLFDPKSRLCTQLPPWPRRPTESGTCVVGIGLNKILTISSGLDPYRDRRLFNVIRVFDFFTGQWRRAADMPGPGRDYFGLAFDPTRGKVLVAGGRDNRFRATRSALLYDVATDEWVQLGGMEKERYGCDAVFHGGKFHVIGGFASVDRSSMFQTSKFRTCSESLDPVTWQWGPVEEESVESNGDSGYCKVLENGEGDLYYVGLNAVVRRGCGGRWEWQVATRIPEELLLREGVATWKDKMVVRGAILHDTKLSYLLLDLKSFEWTRLGLPEEYSSRLLEKVCGMDL